MDVRLLFPNQYIGAADMQGKEVSLTISRVVKEALRTEKGTENKPVVFFAEMEARHRAGKGENKRLVLNKTNAKTIAKLYGNETDSWPGKRVTLYATTCTAFGQIVDCVRVREVAPPAPKRRQPEPPPAEDEFSDGDEAAAE